MTLNNMKIHTSITVEESTITKVENTLKEGLFRSKSHLFEYAVLTLLGGSK